MINFSYDYFMLLHSAFFLFPQETKSRVFISFSILNFLNTQKSRSKTNSQSFLLKPYIFEGRIFVFGGVMTF